MHLLQQLNEQLLDQFKLFVDMDGVVADFDKGVYDLLGYYPNDAPSRNKMWKVIHSQTEVGSGFYTNLPVMADAHLLMEFVKDLNPVFLTSTGHSNADEVARQKKEWLHQHFPGIDIITVQSSSEKQQYVDPHVKSILIDDRLKSIEPWKSNGGWGILHTSAKDTISTLRDIIGK